MVPGKLQSRAEPEADLSALLAVRQQLPHCGIWVVKSKRIAIVVYSSVRYSEWQLPDYLCPPAGWNAPIPGFGRGPTSPHPPSGRSRRRP